MATQRELTRRSADYGNAARKDPADLRTEEDPADLRTMVMRSEKTPPTSCRR
ncbi:MAG: hypothetical protein ACOCZS_02085 [Verrucomicrobiota bacterium]